MSSLQLEWTSFIKEDYSPPKKDLFINGKFFPKKFKMRKKDKMVSPERGYCHDETDGIAGNRKDIKSDWMPDNLEERRTNSDDVSKLSRSLQSRDLDLKTHQNVKSEQASTSTRCGETDLNSNVLKSSKTRTENRPKDDDEEARKWTRDVIFEAEQLVIKSEIDQIKTEIKKKKLTDTNDQTSKEALLSQLKETKFDRSVSSSTPSLLNSVEDSTCSNKLAISAVDRKKSNFKSQEEMNSRKSSKINSAKRISRSTGRSLKSLNYLGLFTSTNETDIPISVKKQHNREGAIALLRAAKNDSIFQIQTLVSHGISTEVLDKRGWTPLYIALENENLECAEVLVQLNADVNFVHENGMSILHQITSEGMYKGVKFLLRHGANVNEEDSQGWPAVHHAIKNNHLKCTALLLAAGCDSEVYTRKRIKEYDTAVRLATVGKWKYHWQRKLDIDIENEIQL